MTKDLKISLHAIIGIKTNETMQVTIRPRGAILHALLDSGSMYNCVIKGG